MAKKNKDGLSCVFTPASGGTGDAVIYKGKEPLVTAHGLETSKGGFWDKAFGVVPGQDYFGKASLPGAGDASKATAEFHANVESMGCSVKSLGINNVPMEVKALPQANPATVAPAPVAP